VGLWQIVQPIVGIGALALVLLVLVEGFETIVLPHRVSRRLRLTRLYFRLGWRGWSALGQRVRAYQRQENVLSIFGPLSLLALLVLWAVLLIVAFAGIQWALGSPLATASGSPSFGTDLYYSGTTFLTLGLGDVTPTSPLARLLTVLEVGTGFGLIALVIGYLPVLYQAFSRRELSIALLDAHAGSPPAAGELLRRHPPGKRQDGLLRLLREWERWAADVLEMYLSYPVLVYFRSQHDNQSWVAALATILDACALVQVCAGQLSDELVEQAHYTYAMARHAAVDLTLYFHLESRRYPGQREAADRLPPADWDALRAALDEAGLRLDRAGEEQLEAVREEYEPSLTRLSQFLLMPLPRWVHESGVLDDWESTT
jgi:hypothetical protein